MSEASPAGILGAARLAAKRAPREGLLVMLVAARRGEGVSTVARDAASEAGAPVLLIDLDMKRNPQARYFAEHGGLGPARDARMGAKLLARVVDASGAPTAMGLSFRKVNGREIHVSALDAPQGSRVQISRDPGYWQALRAAGANVLVDAPSFDRGDLALKLAPFMDAVVLVVAAHAGAAPPAMAARAALAEAGAHVSGLVFARASKPVMALDRLTRLAG